MKSDQTAPQPPLWNATERAMLDAAGLCESESRKWEAASPKTAEHWAAAALLLRSGSLVSCVQRDEIARLTAAVEEARAQGWQDAVDRLQKAIRATKDQRVMPLNAEECAALLQATLAMRNLARNEAAERPSLSRRLQELRDEPARSAEETTTAPRLSAGRDGQH